MVNGESQTPSGTCTEARPLVPMSLRLRIVAWVSFAALTTACGPAVLQYIPPKDAPQPAVNRRETVAAPSYPETLDFLNGFLPQTVVVDGAFSDGPATRVIDGGTPCELRVFGSTYNHGNPGRVVATIVSSLAGGYALTGPWVENSAGNAPAFASLGIGAGLILTPKWRHSVRRLEYQLDLWKMDPVGLVVHPENRGFIVILPARVGSGGIQVFATNNAKSEVPVRLDADTDRRAPRQAIGFRAPDAESAERLRRGLERALELCGARTTPY